MKKAVVLILLLMMLAMVLITTSPLASSASDLTPMSPALVDDVSDDFDAAPNTPSPHTLLLVGSGLIGLIIYRKKQKGHF